MKSSVDEGRLLQEKRVESNSEKISFGYLSGVLRVVLQFKLMLFHWNLHSYIYSEPRSENGQFNSNTGKMNKSLNFNYF